MGQTLGRFVFSTPYTPSGKAHGEVDEQFMLKTILTSAESFPYVKRRSRVVKADKVGDCVCVVQVLQHYYRVFFLAPDQFDSA